MSEFLNLTVAMNYGDVIITAFCFLLSPHVCLLSLE